MKQKINLRLTLIALIAILATSFGLTGVYYNLLRQQVREDIQVNAELLRDSGLFRKPDWKDIQTQSEFFRALIQETLRVTWIDEDGDVLFDNDTDAAGLGNHLDRPEIKAAIANGVGESVRHSETAANDNYYYALLLDNGTILRVSRQARTFASVMLTAAPIILSVMALSLVLCIVIGHMLTISILAPIDDMAEHIDDHERPIEYKELEPFAKKIRTQHEGILAAAKSRQDFTANISHELKTPLTAISGYAELIENQMIAPEQETHIAKQIRHNSNRLLTLINDIIKLAELDHSEIQRQFVPENLYSIAKNICESLQMAAGKKNVTLRCVGEDTVFAADRDLLQELVGNLVQNAIQYSNAGGYVLVKVSHENGKTVLAVEDNGIGIPADQQERIFERFYRVDKSRSRESGGTGLGLAIVKHIAEIHQAEISVNSLPGRGTTIIVTF